MWRLLSSFIRMLWFSLPRHAISHFGEVIELSKSKEQRFRKRLFVFMGIGNVKDAETLIKSNITRYTKILADSYFSDLGIDVRRDQERALLAGRIHECEYLLKEIKKARQFFKMEKNENIE